MSEEMGSLAVDPKTGQYYQLQPRGWTPVSEEAAFAKRGVVAAAGRSAVEGLTGLGNLAFPGGFSAPGNAEAQQAGMAQDPLSTMVGAALPDIAMMGVPLARGASALGRGAARLPGAMAQRVMGRINTQGAAAAEAAAGARSVGAAEATTAAETLPDAMGGGLVEKLIDGGPLTADQARLLPIGDRLGFKPIPGMTGRADSPGKMYSAAMLGRPEVRYALQGDLEANAATMEGYALRAGGAPPGSRWGTEAWAAARRDTGAGFNRIRDALPESVTLPEAFIAQAEKLGKGIGPEVRAVLEPIMDVDAEGVATRAGANISREDLFALRSDLNLLANDLASTQGRRLAANRVGDLSTQLDDFIRSHLTPEQAADWHKYRVQYLIQKLMEKPGIMQPDGSMSLRSARTVMTREMPDAFRQTIEGARGRLTPEVRDFLDAVDYGSAFADLVPNSGTATRLSLSNMTTRQWAQGKALRWWLGQERKRLQSQP